MKLKIVGIGQCGSYIVYDCLAWLFNGTPSKKLEGAVTAPFRRAFANIKQAVTGRLNNSLFKVRLFFEGQRVAAVPAFCVIDGNENNPIIDGLMVEGDLTIDENVLIDAISLESRKQGCSIGQLGEYAFSTEPQSTINSLGYGDSSTELNINVFSTGGGSGSGGSIVVAKKCVALKVSMLNIAVCPELHTNSTRLQNNTGRFFVRYSFNTPRTGLCLYSNRSSDADDLQAVNDKVRNLIVRCANFSYPSSFAKVGTDFDLQDFMHFLSGKLVVVGSFSASVDALPSEMPSKIIDRCLSNPEDEPNQGLSVYVPQDKLDDFFKSFSKAVVIIGIPKDVSLGNGKAFTEGIKLSLIEKMNKQPDFDVEVFSYGSLSEIEATVFLRHFQPKKNFYVRHFVAKYMAYRESEATEFEYLNQEATEENEPITDCLTTLSNEINDDDKLKDFFSSIKFPEWATGNLETD